MGRRCDDVEFAEGLSQVLETALDQMQRDASALGRLPGGLDIAGSWSTPRISPQ